jgi:hypothetical protein
MNGSMTSRPVPQLPNYRITLFYGPEPDPGPPEIQTCVFNVKKRSWKAGIQAAIEVAQSQLDRVRSQLKFPDWVHDLPAGADQKISLRRAEELFVQAVCALKLDLAIEAGLVQENQRLDADMLVEQLDARAGEAAAQIKSHILNELDLEPEANG